MFFNGSKKELQKKLSLLSENIYYGQQLSQFGSWTHDLKTGDIFFTDAVYQILGVTPEELDGDMENIYKIVHKDDLQRVKETIEGELSGVPYDLEYRIVTPDGNIKFVHVKTKAIYNENNEPVKTIGIIRDITRQKQVEKSQREFGDSLNQAREVACAGIWKYDVLKKEFIISEGVYQIFNNEPDDFAGDFQELLRFVHPEDRAKTQEAFDKLMSGHSCSIELRIFPKNQEEKYIDCKCEPIFDKDKNVIALYGTIHDVTEKKQLQTELEKQHEKLVKQQRLYQALVRNSSDVFEVMAADGTILYISEASEAVIGYKPEERIGKKVHEFYSGEEYQKVIEMLEKVMQYPGKELKEDIIFTAKGQKKIHLEVHLQNLLHDPDVNGIVAHLRNVTDRKEMEEQLEYISTHDDLTGLPNRVYLNKYLKKLCHDAKGSNCKYALMVLEINGYKYFNDALGYEIGDQLIVEVSKRLKNYLGSSFLCRHSVDRFMFVVQSDDGFDEFRAVARNIIKLFSNPVVVDKYELNVILNIGIGILNKAEPDPDILIKQSETALFWAKKEGKNKYKFHSSNISIQDYKQFELRNDLVKAIENNELKVYYQPIVKLGSSELLAAEALVRWEHPDWGLVSPAEFIMIAEESGLIIDVGNWVFREVCRNYKKWINEGFPGIKIAVNFSSTQLLEENFVENIIKTINEFSLDPSFLILEISESVIIENTDMARRIFDSLRYYGIQMALDDFGTGYSCLAYINSFNIDIIKVDGSFIRKVLTDKTSSIITKNIVKMAKELEIKLVAEGIENWDQLTFLKELKCYAGQGFLYSKPVPAESFEPLLKKRKCKPVIVNDTEIKPVENRRRYFRIGFNNMLEAGMTIKDLNGRQVNIGTTKVLVKNIGPGGLCFISNIKLPVRRDLILHFTVDLLDRELEINGCIVWSSETENELVEYGVEFIIDEGGRMDLIQLLAQVRVKMKNDIMFAKGSFVTCSAANYFKNDSTRDAPYYRTVVDN